MRSLLLVSRSRVTLYVWSNYFVCRGCNATCCEQYLRVNGINLRQPRCGYVCTLFPIVPSPFNVLLQNKKRLCA